MFSLDTSHLQQSTGPTTTQIVRSDLEKFQDQRVCKISLQNLKKIHTQRLENEKLSPSGKKRFRILFTGDTHSNLEPSIASFVSEKALGGVVRRIQYLEQVRAISNHPVLVIDAGDFLQGTPYFDSSSRK
jgi:2',3'-cyclic-nucleotide 2'-phosphodiesterase (5'-nucleotidase family)